eukprot:5214977-Pyramimonas_sp.AAC.1
MGASTPGFLLEIRQPFASVHARVEHGHGLPHVGKSASLWEKPRCHEPGGIQQHVGERRFFLETSPHCAKEHEET